MKVLYKISVSTMFLVATILLNGDVWYVDHFVFFFVLTLWRNFVDILYRALTFLPSDVPVAPIHTLLILH